MKYFLVPDAVLPAGVGGEPWRIHEDGGSLLNETEARQLCPEGCETTEDVASELKAREMTLDEALAMANSQNNNDND